MPTWNEEKKTIFWKYFYFQLILEEVLVWWGGEIRRVYQMISHAILISKQQKNIFQMVMMTMHMYLSCLQRLLTTVPLPPATWVWTVDTRATCPVSSAWSRVFQWWPCVMTSGRPYPRWAVLPPAPTVWPAWQLIAEVRYQLHTNYYNYLFRYRGTLQ